MTEVNSEEKEEDDIAKRQQLSKQLYDIQNVILTPAFRGDWKRFGVFLLMLLIISMLAYSFPSTVVRMLVLTIGSLEVGLAIPVLLFIPILLFLSIIHRRLNTRYILCPDRLIIAIGIISLKRSTKEMYFNNVRAIEVDQSIVGRLLRFGNVRVGPFVANQGDILIKDVRNPNQVKSMLDRRLHNLHFGTKDPDPTAGIPS